MDFNTLVKKYQEPLYWHIRRLVVCHEDTRDILQETLLQAWRSFKKLRDERAIRGWLYKIATNNCYQHLNRSRKHRQSTEDLSEMLIGRLESNSFVNYEQGEALIFQKALLALTEQQRAAFTLRYYDEMSYEEIAEITGSTAVSLRVSYHHACQHIRNYLKTHCDHGEVF